MLTSSPRMSPFGTKVRRTAGSPETRRVLKYCCLFPSEYGTVIQMPRHQVAPERRASDMLTLGEFLAVLSLTITAFSFGYRLGRDKKNDINGTKNIQE